MIDRVPTDAEGDAIRGKLGIPKKGQSGQKRSLGFAAPIITPFPALETDVFEVPSRGIAKPSRRPKNGRLVAFFSTIVKGGRSPPGRLARSAPIFHRLIIRLMTVMSLPVSRLNVEDLRPSTGSTSATRPSVWWNRFWRDVRHRDPQKARRAISRLSSVVVMRLLKRIMRGG
jgi:hypothetical protein